MVKAKAYQRWQFARIYDDSDVDLLAYVDKAYGSLSGPATKRILEREHIEYGQAAYGRLAKIPVAQLCRIRNSAAYRKRNASYQPTRPTPVTIGERRKPQPNGLPGYLRIDTVHQGDRDGEKGLYHINAVDQVTQWEIVPATPHISEMRLIPVPSAMLAQFPFLIRGFHSDNGSEFINHTVAKLLEKLRIEQTRLRAHCCGDNGLVETKNGAVIRKHVGFGHIAAGQCRRGRSVSSSVLESVSQFSSSLRCARNCHRRKRQTPEMYRRWATPLERLQEVADCEKLLQPGVTSAKLQLIAQEKTDTEAALEMQRAKRKLLSRIGPLRT